MDYLDWQSNLRLQDVFGGAAEFSFPSVLSEGKTLYLGKDKSDNRAVLKLICDETTVSVTPAPYNLQTRVNEYGGKPYWLCGSSLVFANQADQCLYRQEILPTNLGQPTRVSLKPTNSAKFMYTDVHEFSAASYLAIIELESASVSHAENAMFIGMINGSETEPLKLIQGADFYSNFCVNEAGNKAAWVQWNHPNMPWDDTELWVADIVDGKDGLRFKNQSQVDLSNTRDLKASVCQLLFSNNDRLFFSADYRVELDTKIQGVGEAHNAQNFDSTYELSPAENFWNVHVYDFSTGAVNRVTNEQREYGYPHWVYGDHRIIQFNGSQLLTIASEPSGDSLVLIDQETLQCRQLDIQQSACTIQHLHGDGHNRCGFELLPFDEHSSLVTLCLSATVEMFALAEQAMVNVETSVAKPVSFETTDGAQAHGFFYTPVNSDQQARTNSDSLPPLLVMVHGGPTARAYGHFDLQKQFWTSRGFAILDVNHRGSSGYGRLFRDSLYGHWGERDTSDIVDGVNYLIDQGEIDPNRVCIRGKSAGGYAVLRALTEYPHTFKVGACYYGIGNLVTLAESTHKFEKHYTDRLIDEVYDASVSNNETSKFYQRSPINKMNHLNSAMIVFQGSLDRVVTPAVANEIISVLVSAGIDHEYVEYSNEGHGFKLPKNNIDAWNKELAFYQRVLNEASSSSVLE